MFPLRHHVRTGLNRIFLHRANVHWTKLRSDDITVPDQEHDLPEKLWDSFLCDSRICPCSLINAPATTIMMDTLCCSAQHVDKHQKSCSPNDMCGAGTHNCKCKACENACIVPESLLPPIRNSFNFLLRHATSGPVGKQSLHFQHICCVSSFQSQFMYT